MVWEYWKCPNTGRVLWSFARDNKVTCRCGIRNPRLENDGAREVFPSGITVHFKFALEPAREAEYLQQLGMEYRRRQLLDSIPRG